MTFNLGAVQSTKVKSVEELRILKESLLTRNHPELLEEKIFKNLLGTAIGRSRGESVLLTAGLKSDFLPMTEWVTGKLVYSEETLLYDLWLVSDSWKGQFSYRWGFLVPNFGEGLNRDRNRAVLSFVKTTLPSPELQKAVVLELALPEPAELASVPPGIICIVNNHPVSADEFYTIVRKFPRKRITATS